MNILNAYYILCADILQIFRPQSLKTIFLSVLPNFGQNVPSPSHILYKSLVACISLYKRLKCMSAVRTSVIGVQYLKMDGWRYSASNLGARFVSPPLRLANVAKVHRNPRSVTQIQALQPRATNTPILRPCNHKS